MSYHSFRQAQRWAEAPAPVRSGAFVRFIEFSRQVRGFTSGSAEVNPDVLFEQLSDELTRIEAYLVPQPDSPFEPVNVVLRRSKEAFQAYHTACLLMLDALQNGRPETCDDVETTLLLGDTVLADARQLLVRTRSEHPLQA